MQAWSEQQIAASRLQLQQYLLDVTARDAIKR